VFYIFLDTQVQVTSGSERDQSQGKKPEWQWEMQAAGMMSLRLGSVENQSSSQSSEAEHFGLAQDVTKKVRAKQNRCRAWTFKSSIETNLLSAEGVPTDEKTKLLAEHVQTRLGHKQPNAVLAVTAFSDLKKVFTRSHHESASVSIPMVYFVQSQQCTDIRNARGQISAMLADNIAHVCELSLAS